jgi:uncharacterized membrane protein
LAWIARSLFVAGLVICWLVLQIRFVRAREFWLDETYTAMLSQFSLARMWAFIQGDVHPPLYYIAISAFSKFAGSTEIALRMPSLLAHLATSIVVACIAKREFRSQWMPLFAFSMCLMSPALFYYAGEARMYSLMVLLGALAIWMMKALDGHDHASIRSLICLGLVLAAGYYTHYAFLFFASAIILCHAISGAVSGRRIKQALIVGLAFLAAVGPWLPIMLKQREVKLSQEVAWQHATADPSTLLYGAAIQQDPRAGVGFYRSWVENLASIAGLYPAEGGILLQLLFSLPFAVVAVIAAIGLWQRNWLIVLTLVAVVAMLAGSLIVGSQERRFLLVLGPLLVLASTYSVHWLLARSRIMGVTLGIAMLASCMLGSWRVAQADYVNPTRSLVSQLSAADVDSEPVVFNALYAQVPVQYYAGLIDLKLNATGFPMGIYEWWDMQDFKGWGSPVPTTKDVEGFVAERVRQAQPFWLVLFETVWFDPQNRLRDRLASEACLDDLTPESAEGKFELYRVTFCR